MIDLFQSSLLAVACVAVPLCLLFWLLAIDRRFGGEPLVAWSPRQPVPWTVFDLLLLLLAGLVIATATQLLLAWYCGLPLERLQLSDPDLTPQQQIDLLMGFSLASSLTWLLSLWWLRRFAAASRIDLGWPAEQRRQDLTLGLVAFIMLIVPMLSIHYLAQRVFPTEETHPFIEMVLQNPRPVYLAPIIVAAVIVAPVIEEFMFRVFLQGWLERLCLRGPRRPPCLAVDALNEPAASPEAVSKPGGRDSCRAKDAANLGSAGASPSRITVLKRLLPTDVEAEVGEPSAPQGEAPANPPIRLEQPTEFDTEAVQGRLARWLPILISGSLFALAHAGQGPAPIPLFFLGLGLGYLYQRTHRILPCIVVHFLVNSTAVVQLALYVAQQGGTE